MAEGVADARLLEELGVTARVTADVERDVIAAAYAAEAPEGGEGDGGGGDDAQQPQPVDEEVSRLEEQLASVERESVAVAAALQALQAPPGGAGGADNDDDMVAAPAPDASLRLAVGRTRLAGLRSRADALRAALAAARDAAARRVADAAAEAAAASLAGAPQPPPLAPPPPPPRAVVLREDDDFDAALGPVRGSRRPAQRRAAPGDTAAGDGGGAGGASGGALVETERDRLIRRGILTPFAALEGFERRLQETVASAAAAAARAAAARPRTMLVQPAQLPRQLPTAREYQTPSAAQQRRNLGDGNTGVQERRKRRAEHAARLAAAAAEAAGEDAPAANGRKKAKRRRTSATAAAAAASDDEEEADSGEGSDEESDDEEQAQAGRAAGGSAARRSRRSGSGGASSPSDDGDEEFAPPRRGSGARRSAPARRKAAAKPAPAARRRAPRAPLLPSSSDDDAPPRDADEDDGAGGGSSGGDDPSDPSEEDVRFEGGLRVPGDIYRRLFDYQRTGVKWLWELHAQRAGGIIGDEMGLGKTVQLAAFLGALHHSGLYRPSLVVCPATMLRQWQRELRAWHPRFRASILHDTGVSASGGGSGRGSSRAAREGLITDVASSSDGILLTTYEQLRLFRQRLLSVPWGYVVLDEGHKIRNPDAEVTILCKQMPTVHRIVMTGAPIQNRLTELWSLFDFCFPGKLGTLPVFAAQFAVPITIGGYANASPLQVSTAYRCAVVLRDLVGPYLLRRVKADVALKLPKKTEQVLFCPLTQPQREAYRAFLASKDCEAILEGRREALAGIDVLRKIVNHPDLLDRVRAGADPDYGNPKRSGKLLVVLRILSLWQSQGHRALLFAQTQQMLDILEDAAMEAGYSYRRMDGNTPIGARMRVIDEFNDQCAGEVFLFLLTTKVGGLGVNLTGADRVLLYDPDWNPATDAQARERAWRVGQTREVTVYRLITAGTIEEKVYHRQIYKQHLTDKILRDPRQKRFFKARELAELFTLDEAAAAGGGGGQTAELFADAVDTEVRAAEAAAAGETAPEGAETARAEAEEDARTGSAAADDSSILASLFSSHGIAGAMDHDAIAGAAGTRERMVISAEAERVSRRAAEALAASRQERARMDVSVPTWTGRSGAAGAPQPRGLGIGLGGGLVAGVGGGMPTAAELLARAKERRDAAAAAGRDAAAENAALRAPAVPEDPAALLAATLLAEVASFLTSRGGRASSEAVAAAFNSRINAAQAGPFRAALRQAATLEKEGAAAAWVLRAQFRPRPDPATQRAAV